MTPKDFIEEFIFNTNIRVIESLTTCNDLGGFTFCLDRGEDLSERETLSDAEVRALRDIENEKFFSKYEELLEDIQIFAKMKRGQVFPFFRIDNESGYFFLEGRFVPDSNVSEALSSLTAEAIDRLVNSQIKESDGFVLSCKLTKEFGGLFHIDVYTVLNNKSRPIGGFRFVSRMDGKFLLQDYPIMKVFSADHLEEALIYIGEESRVRAIDFYKVFGRSA